LSFQNYLYGVYSEQPSSLDSFLFSLIALEPRDSNADPSVLPVREPCLTAQVYNVENRTMAPRGSEHDCDDVDMDYSSEDPAPSSGEAAWDQEEGGQTGQKSEDVLKTKDVKRIMAEAPEQIQLRDVADGLASLNENFYQVC
jgi:hypothetical protein